MALLLAALQFFTLSTTQVVFHYGIGVVFASNFQSEYYKAPRVWHSVDLKTIDPRFAQVVSVDLEGLLVITGSGQPGSLCQVWVEFRKPGSFPEVGGHNYQWQSIAESQVTTEIHWDSPQTPSHFGSRWTVPNMQQPRKTVALTNGVFEYMWAFEPSCPSIVNIKAISARLP